MKVQRQHANPFLAMQQASAGRAFIGASSSLASQWYEAEKQSIFDAKASLPRGRKLRNHRLC
jgi:hypothetical protein